MSDDRPKFCPRCGHEAPAHGDYCANCGADILAEAGVVERDPGHTQPAEPAPTAPRDTDTVSPDYYFLATTALFGVWVIGTALGYSGGSNALLGLALLAWVVSLGTMAADLRLRTDQDGATALGGWVLAGILLYLVTVPYYIYKRQSLVDKSGRE